jgi:hypothetical protein
MGNSGVFHGNWHRSISLHPSATVGGSEFLGVLPMVLDIASDRESRKFEIYHYGCMVVSQAGGPFFQPRRQEIPPAGRWASPAPPFPHDRVTICLL